jgi:hypothetical protein
LLNSGDLSLKSLKARPDSLQQERSLLLPSLP